jgi:hypothetical protein
MMINQSDAAALRRWAMECSAQAEDPRSSAAEREHLLKMQKGLLDMAQTQDWLDGEQPMQTAAPPVSGLGSNVPRTPERKWN